MRSVLFVGLPARLFFFVRSPHVNLAEEVHKKYETVLPGYIARKGYGYQCTLFARFKIQTQLRKPS